MTMKPTAAKWTALNEGCASGLDWRDEPELALRAKCRPGGADAAHFFIPHFDLPRTWPHDHRPRSRTPGHLRSGNRTEVENQAPERRAHAPHPPPPPACPSRIGNDAWRRVLLFRHLGIFFLDHRLCFARSSLFH